MLDQLHPKLTSQTSATTHMMPFLYASYLEPNYDGLSDNKRLKKNEPRLLFRMNTNKAINHQHKLPHFQKTPLIKDPDNHVK